jgi:hypothetical protein
VDAAWQHLLVVVRRIRSHLFAEAEKPNASFCERVGTNGVAQYTKKGEAGPPAVQGVGLAARLLSSMTGAFVLCVLPAAHPSVVFNCQLNRMPYL